MFTLLVPCHYGKKTLILRDGEAGDEAEVMISMNKALARSMYNQSLCLG